MKPKSFTRGWVASKLREARDLMNDDGAHWVQGTWKSHGTAADGGDKFCALGGINTATGADEYSITDNRPETRALAIVIVKSNPQIGAKRERARFEKALAAGQEEEAGHIACGIVMRFNDKRSTKWEDVKAAFTTAARSLR